MHFVYYEIWRPKTSPDEYILKVKGELVPIQKSWLEVRGYRYVYDPREGYTTISERKRFTGNLDDNSGLFKAMDDVKYVIAECSSVANMRWVDE